MYRECHHHASAPDTAGILRIASHTRETQNRVIRLEAPPPCPAQFVLVRTSYILFARYRAVTE
jgi:hypothetical protein